MDLAAHELALRHAAGAVVVDPRFLRRVIKYHHRLSGLVPHDQCYPIAKTELLALAGAEELGLPATDIPDPVILIARPSPRFLRTRSDTEVITRLWRDVFHARVHLALARRQADGCLDDVQIRKRIELIGPTEFNEIRAILSHDDLVLPPGTDREVYVEFVAVYLELRHFAPRLLVTTFPGLSAFDKVDEAIALDVDPLPLLSKGRPVAVQQALGPTGTVGPWSPISVRQPLVAPSKEIPSKAYRRLEGRARKAQEVGNDVRAVLHWAVACGALEPQLRQQAEESLQQCCGHLGQRLHAALGSSIDRADDIDWPSLIVVLAHRAAADSSRIRYGIEARVLYTLQRASLAAEKQHEAVDVASYILSRGKRKIVRKLESTKELRVARAFQVALARAQHVRLTSSERKRLTDALGHAVRIADRRTREALRPRFRRVFDQVGLVATSTPEQLSRDKLIEELMDQVLLSGYLTFPQLRDAISRNQLKLADLKGSSEWIQGDALLEADRRLETQLDGIYRRSDIYLRGMQKASSLSFGTRVGRVISLYVLLPLGAAFVLLEGVGHLVGPLWRLFGAAAPNVLTLTSFFVTSTILFGILHSEPLRAFGMQILEMLGVVIAWVFFRIPRAILTIPAVQQWFARPGVRLVLRRIVVPILLAVVAFYLTPLRKEDWFLGLAGSLATFVTVSLLAGTRIGQRVEDYVLEQLVPTWQVLSHQWIPQLLQLIARSFAVAMEWLLRGMIRVDELLRYQQGHHGLWTVVRASFGLCWAMVAYVIRVYVTLLVEPELNPLKHFPIITVAHKLTLPFAPQMLAALQIPLSPLGPIVGGAIAGVTAFLAPSVTGFLAWELKENYKLYRATIPDRLVPARFGAHGETMRGLLVAGIHSGTLPKLYERLRRAASREHEQVASQIARVADGKSIEGSGAAKFREGIAEVERAIRRFVERELLAYLLKSSRWRFGPVSIASVELSSNRIRIRLTCEQLGRDACEIAFEQQGGRILAGMPSVGFVDVLVRRSRTSARIFENALAGFYQRAEVDLVREQIEEELGEGTHFEIAEEGLVCWPGNDYRTEYAYGVDAKRPKALAPKIKGLKPAKPPRPLDARKILFRHQAISWLSWVSAWVASDDDAAEIPRLLSGTSILPRTENAWSSNPPSVRPEASPTAAWLEQSSMPAHKETEDSASPPENAIPLDVGKTQIGPGSPSAAQDSGSDVSKTDLEYPDKDSHA